MKWPTLFKKRDIQYPLYFAKGTTVPKIKGSALVFDEDEVKKSTDPLMRLTRLIMYRFQITVDDFLMRYHRYFSSFAPNRDNKTAIQKSTTDRRTLISNDTVTYKMMKDVIKIMGYDITEVSIKLKDRTTNEIYEFSTTMTIDELKAALEKENKIGLESLV